ncbi:MAG: 50S ribosomal protein L18 [Phycisphaerae bacterium]
MDKNKEKDARLLRRKRSVRKNLFGTHERPRLSVFRSAKHIYVQIVDDYDGKTLVSANSLMAGVADEAKHGANVAAAQAVGKAAAEKALAAGIKQVAFDRGGRKYHGRIKAVAEAAREAGLEF